MKFWGRKRLRTCLSMLLIVTCFLTSSLLLSINARADDVIRTGTVTTASMNFRSGPGTEYSVITYIYSGDEGTILDEAVATTGVIWYKMNISNVIGWASSKYIKVTERLVTEDQAFDEYLTAQGFPASYKSQLQALHAKYPNWLFEAQQTNLDWSDAITAESKLGKNLVHSGADSSWKSTENGAYDWNSDTWIEFDSGGWVAASTAIVQYFMDPRNFLDSTNIFQFIKQSYEAASMTDEQLEAKKTDLTSMVQNTYLAGTCPGTETSYVDVIMDAAAKSGVCPFTLASMMIQEQGINGTGRSISGTVPGYEGYYNYLNIAAYKTSTMSAVERGLWYAKGGDNNATSYNRPWNNATASIVGGATYYGKGYVKVGQDTLYLKKFNVQGDNLYSHQYMTNVQGASSEGKHMAKAYDENARKSALVFKIPVYNNMPEKPCTMPTGSGNPNNMLQSLEVLGCSLTPTFNMYETSYSLIVSHGVTNVTIHAQALAATANVEGTGNHELQVGGNKFDIVVSAQSGTKRTYTINIVRQEESTPIPPSEPEPPVTPIPSISTSEYQMNPDRCITGITDFPISVSNFAVKFSVDNGTVKITTANGTEKTESSNIGTGDQVRVYDNDGVHQFTYQVIIYGDTNGDGTINALDLLRVQKDILSIGKLDGLYSTAADTSKDGTINPLDLLQVQKQILNIKAISQ